MRTRSVSQPTQRTVPTGRPTYGSYIWVDTATCDVTRGQSRDINDDVETLFNFRKYDKYFQDSLTPGPSLQAPSHQHTPGTEMQQQQQRATEINSRFAHSCASIETCACVYIYEEIHTNVHSHTLPSGADSAIHITCPCSNEKKMKKRTFPK